MFHIRAMHASDFDAVRRLDRDVFVAWGQTHRGLLSTRPPRTRANIRQNHADDPAGCFVAVEDGVVVGYVFSHTWGQVGWLGTFGVRLDCQGRGIGGALIDRSVAYLEAAGCTTVGLATMPDSAYNIGLYMRHGFHPDGLTLRLRRTVNDPTSPSPHGGGLGEGKGLLGRLWRALPPDERESALEACAALADALWPGLDYRKVIQYVPGETLLWGDPLWGFAAVHTVPKLENSTTNAAVVDALVLDPDHANRWPAVFRSLEAFAANQGLRGLAFSLPDRQREPLATALAAGYRFVHVNLVMTRRRPAIRWAAGVHGFAWVM